MKSFLREMFLDETGSVSFKRVTGFVCTLFLCVTLMANSFSHEEVKPSSDLVNAVMVIACACIGASSIDKFSKKSNSEPTGEINE